MTAEEYSAALEKNERWGKRYRDAWYLLAMLSNSAFIMEWYRVGGMMIAASIGFYVASHRSSKRVLRIMDERFKSL